MITDMQKFVIRNVGLDNLIECILERTDVDKLVEKFRTHDDLAPREYMKVKEFANYIESSEAYVRRLAKFGLKNSLFSVVQIGNTYRIDRISYDKWISRGGKF